MPEFVHVLRGIEDVQREPVSLVSPGQSISVHLWPWPFVGVVCFTFDCEGTYGDGSSFRGETEVVPHLARFFRSHSVKGTFNVLGRMAVEYPTFIGTLHECDQEIAGHGYSHEYLDSMTYSEQMAEINRTVDAIKSITGSDIRGWRSPFATFNRNTYDILVQKGFEWTSNFGRSLWGHLPFQPIIEGETFPIVEIPFDDVHFDAMMFFWIEATAEQIEPLWKNHIVATRRNGLLFVFLAHPVNLAEEPYRVTLIENVLAFAQRFGDIWIASCGEICRWYHTISKVALTVDSARKQGNVAEMKLTIRNSGAVGVNNAAIRVQMSHPIRRVESSRRMPSKSSIEGRPTAALIRLPELKASQETQEILKIHLS